MKLTSRYLLTLVTAVAVLMLGASLSPALRAQAAPQKQGLSSSDLEQPLGSVASTTASQTPDASSTDQAPLTAMATADAAAQDPQSSTAPASGSAPAQDQSGQAAA